MAKYRFVGSVPDSLDGGQPVEPGEFVNLSDEEALLPQNMAMLADGRLAPTGAKSEEIADKAGSRVARLTPKTEENS